MNIDKELAQRLIVLLEDMLDDCADKAEASTLLNILRVLVALNG